MKNNNLDIGFIGDYHNPKVINKNLPALIANSISRQYTTIRQKNDGPIPRHNQVVAADRPNHTGVTAIAAATKLLNAIENGKHKTPPPAGTPAHRESACISMNLERNIDHGGEGRNAGKEFKCGKEHYLQSAGAPAKTLWSGESH